MMFATLWCLGVPVDVDPECARCAYVTDHAFLGWITRPYCVAREKQCFMGRHLCALDATGTNCYSPQAPPVLLFEYKDDREGSKEELRRSQPYPAVKRRAKPVSRDPSDSDNEGLAETLDLRALASPSPVGIALEDTNHTRPVPVPTVADDLSDPVEESKDVWRDVPGGLGGLRERCTACTIVVTSEGEYEPVGSSCAPYNGQCALWSGAEYNECFADVDRSSCYNAPTHEVASSAIDPSWRCGKCTHIASEISPPDNLLTFDFKPFALCVVKNGVCLDVEHGMQCAADEDGTACIDLDTPPASPVTTVQEAWRSVFKTIVATLQTRRKALWVQAKSIWTQTKKSIWTQTKARLKWRPDKWRTRSDDVAAPPAACTGCTAGRVNGLWSPLAVGTWCTRIGTNCWDGAFYVHRITLYPAAVTYGAFPRLLTTRAGRHRPMPL